MGTDESSDDSVISLAGLCLSRRLTASISCECVVVRLRGPSRGAGVFEAGIECEAEGQQEGDQSCWLLTLSHRFTVSLHVPSTPLPQLSRIASRQPAATPPR